MPAKIRRSRSTNADNRKQTERVLATEGIHHDIVVSDSLVCSPGEMDEDKQLLGTTPSIIPPQDLDRRPSQVIHALAEEHHKGHAHDPLTETLYLDIGTGDTAPSETPTTHIVCESPGAVDDNLFEAAYQEEMQRIHSRRGKTPTIYLTRRVENNRAIREHESVIKGVEEEEPTAGSRWKGLAKRVRGGGDESACEDDGDGDK